MYSEKDNQPITVVKASGETAVFEPDKLRRSLENAGASPQVIQRVYDQLKDYIHDGISTKKIYNRAYSLLKKITRTTAAKYQLKKAILQLGPSGYPFENFVAELLKYQGYDTEVGKIIKGFCIDHEIDVIARNTNHTNLVECKFHSDQSRKSDVKTPLYVHSRFRDIERAWKNQKTEKNKPVNGWIVTNTRFSEDAYQYGKCAGLRLISWDQPGKGSLKSLIGLSGLHPITCLTTLSSKEKDILLNEGIVLCKQALDNQKVIDKLALSNKRKQGVLEEITELCEV